MWVFTCTLLLMVPESAAFRGECLPLLSEVTLIFSTSSLKDKVTENGTCQSFAFLPIVLIFAVQAHAGPHGILFATPLWDIDVPQCRAAAAPCCRSSGPARSNLRASVKLNYVSTWEDSESGSNKIIFCYQWDLMERLSSSTNSPRRPKDKCDFALRYSEKRIQKANMFSICPPAVQH